MRASVTVARRAAAGAEAEQSAAAREMREVGLAKRAQARGSTELCSGVLRQVQRNRFMLPWEDSSLHGI